MRDARAADRAEQQREHYEQCGLHDPHITELDQAHDEHLDAQDRGAELASLPFFGVQADRPSDRERRQHYDESRVRNILRPRTGNVEVQPQRKAA